jgi:hypothetical protein
MNYDSFRESIRARVFEGRHFVLTVYVPEILGFPYQWLYVVFITKK